MSHQDLFDQFVATISKLRHPTEGCPWDLKQTHKSLIKYLIEETFEAVEAIEKGQHEQIKDELGDILLQVVLHSVIANENNHFDISDVIEGINAKMIRRHPHVFSDLRVESIDEVKKNWEEIKKSEDTNPPSSEHTFSKRILSNTALLSSFKIGEKTQKIDFDWDNAKQVSTKVDEELLELKEEINNGDREKVEEEFGDLLFSIVQLGRHLKIDPELALRKANKKFIHRFTEMERHCEQKNLRFSDLNRSTKEEIWKLIKRQEK